jgi:hypothetical protein
MIHGPIVDNGIWRTRYNSELYKLYDELDIVKVIKQEDSGGWDTCLECKNWILAESLLFLKQEALSV